MFQFALLNLIIAFSVNCFAESKSLSYEQVEQVANYLAARVETPSKKLLSCDVPVAKSTLWLSGPVREMLDSQRPEEIKKFKQNSKAYISKIKGCATRCTCNAYNMLLPDLSDQTETADYKELDTLLTAETKKLTKEQSLNCAQKLTWFCKSKFHSYLLKQ